MYQTDATQKANDTAGSDDSHASHHAMNTDMGASK